MIVQQITNNSLILIIFGEVFLLIVRITNIYNLYIFISAQKWL